MSTVITGKRHRLPNKAQDTRTLFMRWVFELASEDSIELESFNEPILNYSSLARLIWMNCVRSRYSCRVVSIDAVCPIHRFTVLCSVTTHLNKSEAGVDLALIKTSLLFLYCCNASFCNLRFQGNKLLFL